MAEEFNVQLHGTNGDLAFLFALNVVIDALVTYRQEFQGEIASRLRAKIEGVKATPGLEEVGPALAEILRALEKSGRSLQRTPPVGTA